MSTTTQQELHENEVGKIIVDCAVDIHRELGPGLLESVYEAILAYRLDEVGLRVEKQVAVPLTYRDLQFDIGFRADLIVNDRVVIELKSVEKTTKAHKKQTLTYMKLTGAKLGFLLNFGDELMKNGITRLINGKLDP